MSLVLSFLFIESSKLNHSSCAFVECAVFIRFLMLFFLCSRSLAAACVCAAVTADMVPTDGAAEFETETDALAISSATSWISSELLFWRLRSRAMAESTADLMAAVLELPDPDLPE